MGRAAEPPPTQDTNLSLPLIRLSPFELTQVIWFKKIILQKLGESLRIIFDKTLQIGCQRLELSQSSNFQVRQVSVTTINKIQKGLN